MLALSENFSLSIFLCLCHKSTFCLTSYKILFIQVIAQLAGVHVISSTTVIKFGFPHSGFHGSRHVQLHGFTEFHGNSMCYTMSIYMLCV